MSVQVISAEMLASNDFKINGTGEAPTISSGNMGSYDSSTDSYYFSSNCRMDWKNWSNIGMTLEKAQKLTKIEFEWEGQVSNSSYGSGFDSQMQTYFNTNLLFINGIADGYDDRPADYQKFARIKNSGSDQWQTTELVPFNDSQYQNAFHKVKWVWEIENSVAKELTIYVDGNLFCHYSGTLYSFSITALGTNILRLDTIDHTNIKYVKVTFYHNPVTPSGGAGSGYIGSSLLSNKKMVGYNVPTSEAESTKTESISEYSDNPVSGKPKGGNGFAKIKLLRQITEMTMFDLTASSNMKDSDDVTPTVIEGGGTYSEQNGYYCNSPTILEYSKNYTPSLLKGSGYIDFEMTGRNDNGYGAERDTGIQIRTVDGNTMIMAAIFANGTNDYGATNNEILRVRSSDNSTIYEFQNADGSALDVNKNDWHDVKIRAYITNNKWVKGECYVDGSLWLSYDVTDDVSVAGWDDILCLRVEIIGADGIKSCKVTRKFEG